MILFNTPDFIFTFYDLIENFVVFLYNIIKGGITMLFRIVMLLCFVFSTAVTFASDLNGVYYNRSGAVLSLQEAGNNITYAELNVLYADHEVSFIGIVQPSGNDYMFTAEYLGYVEDDELTGFKFPFYIDIKENEMVSAVCKFKITDEGIKITSFLPQKYLEESELPKLNGIYKKREQEFILSFPLTAYVIQKNDPYLGRYFMTRKDAYEWWFDELEAGYDFELGNHPRCIWAEPSDMNGEKIGVYLLTNDLSTLYKNNKIIFDNRK